MRAELGVATDRDLHAAPTVLIIDDDPLNRRAVRGMLERSGYGVVEAEDGPQGLALLASESPDAVLLDVVMPGMDGLEVLARIKAAEEHYIPVLVLSGSDERDLSDRVLRRGADGFIGRPFQRADLLGRLETLLDVREHRRQLAQRHTQLVALQEYREDLANLLVHDLKNPLSVISGNLSYLAETSELAPDAHEALADAIDATSLLARMIGNLIDVGKAEQHELAVACSPVDIEALFARVARGRQREATLRGATLECIVDGPVIVNADSDVLQRVVENLIENALRYVPKRGRVVLRARVDGGHVQLEVGNSGPPVPVENRRLVFEKFGQGRRRSGMPRVDLGLGLYFCRLVVEAHGGTISVEERADLPTTFVIVLPL